MIIGVIVIHIHKVGYLNLTDIDVCDVLMCYIHETSIVIPFCIFCDKVYLCITE